ncbi:hypothetical protein AVEN_49602-1 [Araneus ventricosus]|uniref:Uncharacterized protein n=1 Tax=Araneus ventricosus TaxID=182803 RepID=A0A4Y2IE07_ARAVE|nr:hypothetical protein AVEN_49602-1 [Araneus ventricosus]
MSEDPSNAVSLLENIHRSISGGFCRNDFGAFGARQVQSWREIGVLFSTERDPNRLDKRVQESHLSLTVGKSDVSQPNRGKRINRAVSSTRGRRVTPIFEDKVAFQKDCGNWLSFARKKPRKSSSSQPNLSE